MHCPDLTNIFNLIRYYTEYSTDAAIAQRLGIDRSNIRNYLYDHENAPYVPVRRHEDFQEFFSEILSTRVSLNQTKALLSGDADSFHSHISPIGGRSWAQLISSSADQSRLVIHKRSPPTLGFGTSTRLHSMSAEFDMNIGDEFTIEAAFVMRGEAVVLAEHAGIWHVIRPNEDSPVFDISGGSHTFPPHTDNEQHYLIEGGPTGFYRYFVIGVRGKFPRTLRDHLQAANPLTQAKLDVIADMIIAGEVTYAVSGTTLRVTS